MKKALFSLAMMVTTLPLLAADGVIGFWKTIDDETNEPKSIVQVYEHQGKVCGRVVELLQNPGAKAKLPGSPSIKGLDIIWDLTKDGDKYKGGEVLDPQKGKVYDAQMWLEGGNLILRGSLFGIGRKQTWVPAKDYKPASDAAPSFKKPKLK